MSHRTNTSTRFAFVRRYPFDLAAVSVAALSAYLIVTTYGSDSSLRLFVTFPLALFLPGYALVSVLFPAGKRRARDTVSAAASTHPRGIDGIERVGLAFVLSLAITPVVVLVLPFTDWGLTTRSITAGLGIVTIVTAQFGVVRRLRTPDGEQFTGSLSAVLQFLRPEKNGSSTLSSVLLVLAIGAAVSALFVGFLMPVSAGGYTELALYSEDEDGEMVAGELPSEIEPGDTIPLLLSIENQEGEDQTYTVVVQQQVVEDGDVVERTELQRIDASVSDGSTGTGERSITPTAAPGDTVRISMLLYHGDPPDEPTNENAAQVTYFWVTVSSPAE
ncbi:DUF1616 domain-containing protein [Natrinema halophilum]|uniref:DUF1616 domain-containing protein n=1 Tax=Natrinema halophilum TaxID=1699371 RepID=A0A7D5GKD5_9EURY|nr:DUF1616 domain-containing protein [Natrinema halophilum]QLG48552.1 DUF1616 domain-containing protein [Natrinema halophilum]